MSVMDPGDPGGVSAAVLAAVREASEEAIVVTNLDGTIVSWSASATRLYGYAPDTLVGRPLALLWPASAVQALAASFARVREGHRVDEVETQRLAHDGSVIDVSGTLSPILNRQGALIGVLSLSRDIRSQRRAEEAFSASQARWRALLDSAVDGIVVIDARGRIEAFNRAAERLFGYSERDVLGKNVNLLMPSPYQAEHNEYLARYLREGEARIIGIGREVTASRRDGSTFPVHLSVGEMAFGGERRFTGILHDLSARTTLEAELREQTALARLGEMAAVIAHEVKNPLAGIRGAMQVIGGKLPEDGAERGITREIVARIDALSELITDMLVFARPPKPHLAPVAVRSLIASTADLLTANPEFKAVTVSIDGEAPPVNADVGLLKIVFENLLMNGAQAMQGRGLLAVSIGSDEQACTVAFRDAGSGISPELREKVFTPFFTTKAKGTGLGLPTCKRLIEAHHGSISIGSPSGGGTIVTVALPLHR